MPKKKTAKKKPVRKRRPVKNVGGRPRVGEGETVRVMVQLPEETLERVDAWRDRLQLTRAQAVRTLMHLALEAEEQLARRVARRR